MKLVLLDAGHGGIDPNGKYTTAPDKQFRHESGSFHGDGWFYEGVWNRRVVLRVAEKLRALRLPYVLLFHDWIDIPLDIRVERANFMGLMYDCLLISSHANASPRHNARGFEVWTTPGETPSDLYAEIHYQHVKQRLGHIIRMRPDTWTDNDHDKEARFKIIQATTMPAILIEHLFFDEINDAILLMREDIVEHFAEAQLHTILRFMHAN